MIRNRILERAQRRARTNPVECGRSLGDRYTGLAALFIALVAGALGAISIAVQIAKVL